MRQDAESQNQILERTSGGFYSTLDGPNAQEPLIFVQDSTVMMMDRVSVKILDRSEARQMIIETYSSLAPTISSLVFADRSVLRAFRKLAGNNIMPYGEENVYYPAIKAFDVLEQLKFCNAQKVLTDVLNHRCWLPDGLDKNDIESWTGMPGVRGATFAAKLRAIEEIVRFDNSSSLWVPIGAFDRANKLERSLITSAQYTGIGSAFSRYRDLTAHSKYSEFLGRTSPDVQDEFCLNGDITKASLVTSFNAPPKARGSNDPAQKSGFTVIATSTTKLSVNKRLTVLDGEGIKGGKSLTVQKLGMLKGSPEIELEGKLNLPSVSFGDVVYLVENVFSNRPVSVADNKWVNDMSYAGPTDRSIPIDVMVSSGGR